MPVLREDVISRLRRLTALNNSRQQSIEDARHLTEGPFEIQGDNGTIMQVSINADSNQVDTDTGNTYTVVGGLCNCPDFAHTGSCVHIQAAELVRTGSTGSERPETISTNRVTPETPEAVNVQAREEDNQRRKRRSRLEVWQERYGDGQMLSQDEEAFKKLYSAVKTGTAINYEYENVLAGSENTFGVEIEFADADLRIIARELGELGVGDGEVGGYHSSRQPGKWTVETDGSVTSGRYRGGEIVSPVLRDCPETWEQLEKVCDVIKRYGGRINSSCGGHVHICANPLDARSFRWNRLMKIWGGFEDVFYRMASGGQSNGQFRGSTYAKPLASILPSKFFRDRQTDEQEIRGHVGSRYHGLNFQNANPGSSKNTVEFRLWNGSLDPRQIQANVKTSMAVIHASENVRRGIESTQERARLIPVSQTMPYGQANSSGKDPDDHAEIKSLLDILFVRGKDKASALWLYASSKWQH